MEREDMKKTSLIEKASIVAQVLAYFLALVLIIQLIRAIFGGTWVVEDIILALLVLNLTITFGIGGYLIHLNNKISAVNGKITGHIQWHKGKDESKLT